MFRSLHAGAERYYGDDDEQHYQDHGKLKEGLFHAAPRPVNAVSLAEYAAEAAAFYLKQDSQYQTYGQNNLRNT